MSVGDQGCVGVTGGGVLVCHWVVGWCHWETRVGGDRGRGGDIPVASRPPPRVDYPSRHIRCSRVGLLGSTEEDYNSQHPSCVCAEASRPPPADYTSQCPPRGACAESGG